MPKYEVTYKQIDIRRSTVVVEASSPEEAKRIADRLTNEEEFCDKLDEESDVSLGNCWIVDYVEEQ